MRTAPLPITVVDKGGNKKQRAATVTDLVTDALTLELSTAGTEGSIIDPESYKPSVGEVLYARTNRASEISVNGGSLRGLARENGCR